MSGLDSSGSGQGPTMGSCEWSTSHTNCFTPRERPPGTR